MCPGDVRVPRVAGGVPTGRCTSDYVFGTSRTGLLLQAGQQTALQRGAGTPAPLLHYSRLLSLVVVGMLYRCTPWRVYIYIIPYSIRLGLLLQAGQGTALHNGQPAHWLSIAPLQPYPVPGRRGPVGRTALWQV